MPDALENYAQFDIIYEVFSSFILRLPFYHRTQDNYIK